jgi:hypothetical protein
MLILSVTGARAMAFYPRTGCGALVDLVVDGADEGDRLRLRFADRTSGDTGRREFGPARGVLAVTDAAGQKRYWNLDIPAPR